MLNRKFSRYLYLLKSLSLSVKIMSSVAGITLGVGQLGIRRRTATVIVAIDTSASMNCTHRLRGFGSGVVSRMKVARDVSAEGSFSEIRSYFRVKRSDHSPCVDSQGACRVIDALSDGDMTAILAFGEGISDVSGGAVECSPSTRARVKRQVSALRANGGTKLYDTILVGCRLVLQIAAAARVIGQAASRDSGSFWFCILTDGEDTRSSSSLRDVLQILRQLNSTLGSELMQLMIIGVKLSPTARRQMQQIASAGGGMTTFKDAQDLEQVDRAFDEFVLRYTQHSVTVAVPNGSSHSEDLSTPRKGEIRPGSLVALRSSVTSPKYRWGSYRRGMHGLVVKVDSDGDAHVQLGLEPDGTPTESLWMAPCSELEVVDDGSFSGNRRGFWTGQLQLGQAVRVPLNLTEPSTRWGSLKRGEVGYVRAHKQESGAYVCDFPSVDGWVGRESDLEVESIATLLRPGEQVRVRQGITPAGGWSNVTSTSIGTVVSISYDGKCKVNFPEQNGWQAYLHELETINRPPTVRATVIDGGVKNCTGRHGLRPFRTQSEGHKVCDFCGTSSGPSGTLMYGCAQCDCDACSVCYRNSSSAQGETTDLRAFQDGAVVVLKGLGSREGAPYNGRTAKVVGFSQGKYHIKCVAGDYAEKRVSETSLATPVRRHNDGAVVTLTGIGSRQDLNGSDAIVQSFVPSTNRYTVRTLETQQHFQLLPENLRSKTIQQLD